MVFSIFAAATAAGARGAAAAGAAAGPRRSGGRHKNQNKMNRREGARRKIGAVKKHKTKNTFECKMINATKFERRYL